jgi:hypothetical protein
MLSKTSVRRNSGHLHARARERVGYIYNIYKYLNVVDMVAIPGCIEELVTKPKDQNILHHFFAQIMVNTEDLLFFPIRFQSFLQLTRAFEIFAEWLLNLVGATRTVLSAFTLSCHVHPSLHRGAFFHLR